MSESGLSESGETYDKEQAAEEHGHQHIQSWACLNELCGFKTDDYQAAVNHARRKPGHTVAEQ